MADPVRIAAIKVELETDPETLGYTAPNAGVQADAITDAALMAIVGQVVDVPTLSGSQLFEAIDDTEWQALAADAKSDIQFVVSLGDNIQISTGTKARTMLARALSGSADAAFFCQQVIQPGEYCPAYKPVEERPHQADDASCRRY